MNSRTHLFHTVYVPASDLKEERIPHMEIPFKKVGGVPAQILAAAMRITQCGEVTCAVDRQLSHNQLQRTTEINLLVDEAAFDEKVQFVRYQLLSLADAWPRKFVVLTAGAARAFAAEIAEKEPAFNQSLIQQLAFAPVAVAMEEQIDDLQPLTRKDEIVRRLRKTARGEDEVVTAEKLHWFAINVPYGARPKRD